MSQRILQGARAVDKDQQGAYATVEYQVLKGPFSDYVAFVSPLEGTLVLKKSLDYESLKNFTVTLRAQDQGSPPKFSDTTLRVIVEDADDQNPKFVRDSYRAELLPDGRIGELKILPEAIKAVDQVIFWPKSFVRLNVFKQSNNVSPFPSLSERTKD